MKRLSVWTLLFAVLSLVFFILLVFLRIAFPLYPLMSYQDAFDLLAPLVLVPLYGLLFWYAARETAGLGEWIGFLVLAGFWAEGHGMHLSANSISNLMDGLARSGLIDLDGNDIYRLTHFYDEFLSHYVWHIGVLGLAALLVVREWRQPAGATTAWWATILAGVIYGFTLFAITVEGNTVPIGLPFCLALTLIGLVWGRKRLSQQPLLAFLLVSCGLASLLYIGWWLYWGEFLGLCEAGFC
ncbi:MAG: hypothetical protein M8467_03085 [Anaerolineae bacterium]|nr:hypothetical protein [Anaerolineae bacterium]